MPSASVAMASWPLPRGGAPPCGSSRHSGGQSSGLVGRTGLFLPDPNGAAARGLSGVDPDLPAGPASPHLASSLIVGPNYFDLKKADGADA